MNLRRDEIQSRNGIRNPGATGIPGFVPRQNPSPRTSSGRVMEFVRVRIAAFSQPLLGASRTQARYMAPIAMCVQRKIKISVH